MMTIEEIKKILPHRYPFLLVDRVLSIEEGEPDYGSLVAIKNVTSNEEFFNGHFPGNPIMPGVLIIEALAQAGAILSYARTVQKYKGIFFMSIESAKFRKPVVPGDQLRLEVTIKKARRTVRRVSGVAMVDGKVVAEAEFTAMMVEPEE